MEPALSGRFSAYMLRHATNGFVHDAALDGPPPGVSHPF